jgi:hypothetical protein
VNGAEVKSAVTSTEADRLAAAQAERLAKRAEQQPLPSANEEVAAPPLPVPHPPKLVAQCSIQLYDSGQVSVDAPLDQPHLCSTMIVGLIQTLIAHAAERGAAAGVEAYRKQPFMRRAFPKRA